MYHGIRHACYSYTAAASRYIFTIHFSPCLLHCYFRSCRRHRCCCLFLQNWMGHHNRRDRQSSSPARSCRCSDPARCCLQMRVNVCHTSHRPIFPYQGKSHNLPSCCTSTFDPCIRHTSSIEDSAFWRRYYQILRHRDQGPSWVSSVSWSQVPIAACSREDHI